MYRAKQAFKVWDIFKKVYTASWKNTGQASPVHGSYELGVELLRRQMELEEELPVSDYNAMAILTLVLHIPVGAIAEPYKASVDSTIAVSIY